MSFAGIFVDVNYGINVIDYAVDTIISPKECQMLQAKFMVWLGCGEGPR